MKNYNVQQMGNGRYEAQIRDVREAGDLVTLKRSGNDVSATYLPPEGLTKGLLPEAIPLEEIRALVDPYPEIAFKYGFALAAELSLYDQAAARAERLTGLGDVLGSLKGADGRVDPDQASRLADMMKEMGLYK